MNKKDLLEGKRILIVDDEPDILETLEELLHSCIIETASSYEEAREKLKNGSFDLAILDIIGVKGYELLALAVQREITAVMLTANALSPEETIKSYKRGAAYFIPKEELSNIDQHLKDVLNAQKTGMSTWRRWLDKFASVYDRKFGPEWQDKDKNFWVDLIGQFKE